MTYKVSSRLVKQFVTLILTRSTGPGGPGSAFGALYISRKQSYASAVDTCKALGEQLWLPGKHDQETEILGGHLKSLKQDRAWIALDGSKFRAIDDTGRLVNKKVSTKLPVLCTQTAPYSNATFADVSQNWQVQVQSNNETVTGYVFAIFVIIIRLINIL